MELKQGPTESVTYFSNQSSSNSSGQSCSRDTVLTMVILPVLYFILFLPGICLNSLAAWIFFSIPSRSHFTIYLKNVVVADIITTLTFPFKAVSDLNPGLIGLAVFVCRGSSVVYYTHMYISILFFGLISIDRCRKTLWPFISTSPKELFYIKLLSVVIWVVLLAISTPNMILTSLPPVSASFSCTDLKTEFGLKWHEGVHIVCQVIFWSNLVAVVVSYTLITKELYSSFARTRAPNVAAQKQDKKKKVRANVFLVLAAFFICFVPFHFTRIPYTLSQTSDISFICQQKLVLFQMKETTVFLSSLNTLLDPTMYFFLCRSFRESLFKVLQLSPGRCRALQDNTDTHAESNTATHSEPV